MRLPYLQVTQETWDYAAQLSQLVEDLNEDQAFVLLCNLWRWGLSLGPDDQPPTGFCESDRADKLLAAAVKWRGPARPLIIALSDLGIIELVHPGIRVRGLDRYHGTWKKNRRPKPGDRTEPERVPPGIPPAPERVQYGTGAETQTQTQTQKKLLGHHHQADHGKPTAVENPVEKPVVVGKEFWDWAMRERLKVHGLEPEPEPPREWPAFWEEFSRRSSRAQSGAYCRYLLDNDFRLKGWPMAVFIQPGVYRSRLKITDVAPAEVSP